MCLKCLHEIFYNYQFQKYNWNSAHSYNRNIWVDNVRKHLKKILFCSSKTVRRMCVTKLIKIFNVFVKYLQLIRPGAELSWNQWTFILFFNFFFVCVYASRDYQTNLFKLQQLHLVGREMKLYQWFMTHFQLFS